MQSTDASHSGSPRYRASAHTLLIGQKGFGLAPKRPGPPYAPQVEPGSVPYLPGPGSLPPVPAY